jgi:threonine synthase
VAQGEFELACERCGERYDMAPLVLGCPSCATTGVVSVLEVERSSKSEPPPRVRPVGRLDAGRYASLLPGGTHEGRVSLGEGGTPLVRSRVVGPRLGLRRLYFKNETANPTWSFKDRYVAVTVNVARSLGFDRAVVSSTGNLGVSAAAFCGAAGLSCVFLAPPDTPQPFLAQAALHGARVLVTTWEGRQLIFEHLTRRRRYFPIGLFLPRPVHNPFGIEGYRTIAYEVVAELGRAPRAVLFPCARGNGLYGTWKGFRDARRWEWAADHPMMVACQPIGANSLEVSLVRGLGEIVELPPIESVATSTRETAADVHALRAILESGGGALSATDLEILDAQAMLGQEGLCVEPSSALPVACLARLLAAGKVAADDEVVCLLTGAGIRWPSQLMERTAPAVRVAPDPAAVDRYLERVGLGGRAG